MKEIINFIEANVDGKTLFTNELVYKLENGALQGVFVSFRLREKMWRQRLSEVVFMICDLKMMC